MKKTWQWPEWCLNPVVPSIEVYVEDDVSGEGCWIEAEPIGRVLDGEGRDAYISVEYQWDGEDYTQDCDPSVVRKRGQVLTVLELLEDGDSTVDGSDVASDLTSEGDDACSDDDLGNVQEATITFQQVTDAKSQP